jgi:hypothetical protein
VGCSTRIQGRAGRRSAAPPIGPPPPPPPSARVLLAFWNYGLPGAQSSCMFWVPSLVPMEHGSSA